jgi:AcrR family transcriptional regulator
VQAAALALAREGGIAYATMERIAEVSGVAKTSLYRRWPTAAAVVMDAFLMHMTPHLAYGNEGTITQRMTRTLTRLADLGAGVDGALLGSLLGAAQMNPELRAAFRDHWVAPRRQLGRAALQTAVDRGELVAGADIDMILDVLYGAVYYRLFVSFQPLTPEYVAALVSRTLHGWLA